MFHCSSLADSWRWLLGVWRDLVQRKSLGHLLVLAGAITAASGFIFYIIDPNVHSPLDGIWYAWVTMTHVGYGDVVPTSFLGRVLASLLILCGIALLALCTATISACFVGRDMNMMEREVERVEKDTYRIEQEESRILLELAKVREQLAQVEQRLKALEPPG